MRWASRAIRSSATAGRRTLESPDAGRRRTAGSERMVSHAVRTSGRARKASTRRSASERSPGSDTAGAPGAEAGPGMSAPASRAAARRTAQNAWPFAAAACSRKGTDNAR